MCMKLPGIAFYGIFKVIFYCLLPYGIMATLPVQSLIGEMTWKLAAWGIAVLLAFSLLTSLGQPCIGKGIKGHGTNQDFHIIIQYRHNRQPEKIRTLGTFSLLNAVSMTICFFGLIGIPGKILNGEMDLYLSKPVSPLFRLTFEKMNPGSFPLVLMSLYIIVYGIKAGGISVGWQNGSAYLFWLAVMAILY